MEDTLIQPKRFLQIESPQIPLSNKISYSDILKDFDSNLNESNLFDEYALLSPSEISLTPVDESRLKQTIIDPTTGREYRDGIIVQGCFADLSNTKANNNNRFYDIPKYLELLKILKKQIHSPKGVYGEYEHPKGYAVHGPSISHKILDVWYDEKTQKVFGIVLILNTERGKIAQQIIKSGGQLAISARAAGEETENPDGTKMAVTKLLVTFDLVYHPGFPAALLNFKQLNESQKIWQESSLNKNGFSGIIYENELKEMETIYCEYINLNESAVTPPAFCFYEWMINLNESRQETDSEEQKQQKVLQDNQTNQQADIEDNLQRATDKDLAQSKNDKLNQMYEAQQQLKDRAVYDNSAGFIDTGMQGPN